MCFQKSFSALPHRPSRKHMGRSKLKIKTKEFNSYEKGFEESIRRMNLIKLTPTHSTTFK